MAAAILVTVVAAVYGAGVAGKLVDGGSMATLLFLFSGSLLVPVKAIVLSLLSLTATFGAMVFMLQDGHLRWLVGDFTATGQLEMTAVFTNAFVVAMRASLAQTGAVVLVGVLASHGVKHGTGTCKTCTANETQEEWGA